MPAIPKSQMRTRKQDKARQARLDAQARRRCTDAVWRREGDGQVGRCQSCGVTVYRAHTFHERVGHVDEKIPKSLGGDPHDPNNCRLLCHSDHFSGPSGAHRKTERVSA